MAKRQVLKLSGVDVAGSPVPAAVKVGGIVYGTRVTGRDPRTGVYPSEPQAQMDQLFQNLEDYLQLAGGSPSDIVFMGVQLLDMGFREQLNATWLRLFPSDSDRPARDTVQRTAALDAGEIAACEFIAALTPAPGQRTATPIVNQRRVLRIPGVAEVHNPAPTAATVANYVHCVRVTGQEPGSGRLPEDPRRQIAQLFHNIDALLRQAGGSLDDLAFIKISLAAGEGEGLQNVAHRDLLNDVWLERFPNREDRPARHTVPATMPEGRLISASFTGILSGGAKRRVIDLPELEYTNNPLPLAVSVGNMLYTSRIRGRDTETGKIATTMEREVELIFASLEDVLRQAGAGLDDLAFMKLFVNDEEHEREFDSHWLRVFPDESSRPARHSFYFDDGRPLAGNATVMGEFIAVLN